MSLPAVNLNSDNLTLNNSGLATLNGAVTGTGALTASGGGTLDVDSTIAAGSVSDSEVTTLAGGTVTTVGGQTYTGSVTLGANMTLTGTTLSLAGVSMGSDNLTLDNSGLATLNGAVSGTTGELTVSGLGALTVDNEITAGSVSDSEATTLNGTGGSETVKTTGAQTYTGALALGAPTTLESTASGNIFLGSTVNGFESLDVETAGTTTFGAPVGGTTALASLTVDGTDASGTIDLNGGTITTTGAQLYGGAVTLTENATVTSTQGGNITFASAVDSGFLVLGVQPLTIGARSLDVETAGTTTFDGAVSGLYDLTVDNTYNSGVIDLNGGSVTTIGSQSYDTVNAINLGADTTLNTGTTLTLGMLAPTGTLPFNINAKPSTVNGAPNSTSFSLTLNSGGAATVNGNISAANNVTLNNGGPATVNGNINASTFTALTTGPLAANNLTLEGNITTTGGILNPSTTPPYSGSTLPPSAPTASDTGYSIVLEEDTTFGKPITLTFNSLLLGSANPKIEAEFYGPGPITMNNAGLVWMSGSLGAQHQGHLL